MAALQLKTHLFLAFRTGRQEKLIPIRRRQQRPQQPLQSSARPAREVRDLGKTPEEPGVRPPAAPAWMTLVRRGAPPSPGQIQFIGQISAFCCRLWSMRCPTWDACCLWASHPLPPCPYPAHHHLGQGPSLGTFSKWEQPISRHPSCQGLCLGGSGDWELLLIIL